MESRIGVEQDAGRQTTDFVASTVTQAEGAADHPTAVLPLGTIRTYHLKIGRRKFALVELRA